MPRATCHVPCAMCHVPHATCDVRRANYQRRMNRADDSVGDILARQGIDGPWHPLTAPGLANRIYATDDVVLRIATDHPEAVEDARTESVAAPVARAAGVLVPRLIAFDDSRTIVDHPYSLWERVHGETLGLLPPTPRLTATWAAVGRQLARLHGDVRDCPDPQGWLDRPDRERDLLPASPTSPHHLRLRFLYFGGNLEVD